MKVIKKNTVAKHCSGPALALLLSVLLAGCMMDEAVLDDRYVAATHNERYPIRVATAPVKMRVAATAGTLSPVDVNKVISFAKDARNATSSRISVRYSSGNGKASAVAQQAVEILMRQGVPRSMIATGSSRSEGAMVSMTFVRKVAVTRECGDWSDNLAGDQYNESYLNHGCAVQHNIAAMVANPEDFERPHAAAPVTAASRANAIILYDEGAAIPGSSTSKKTEEIK